MESNLYHDPILGGAYPFIIYLQDRYKSESHLNNGSKPELFSREDKYDENLPKEETSGKSGKINAPEKQRSINAQKITFLNSYDILYSIFILPHQHYGLKFYVHMIKMTNDHEINLHRNQFTSSLYVQLMMINMRILCHIITLIIHN